MVKYEDAEPLPSGGMNIALDPVALGLSYIITDGVARQDSTLSFRSILNLSLSLLPPNEARRAPVTVSEMDSPESRSEVDDYANLRMYDERIQVLRQQQQLCREQQEPNRKTLD